MPGERSTIAPCHGHDPIDPGQLGRSRRGAHGIRALGQLAQADEIVRLCRAEPGSDGTQAIAPQGGPRLGALACERSCRRQRSLPVAESSVRNGLSPGMCGAHVRRCAGSPQFLRKTALRSIEAPAAQIRGEALGCH